MLPRRLNARIRDKHYDVIRLQRNIVSLPRVKIHFKSSRKKRFFFRKIIFPRIKLEPKHNNQGL